MAKKPLLTRVISSVLTLLLLLGLLPMGTFAASAETLLLELDSLVSITIPEGDSVEFTYTPTESGKYAVYSEKGYDPRVYVYDSNGDEIGDDDDNGNDYNFYLKLWLDADETYTIKVESVSGNEESCDVGLIKALTIQSIEVARDADTPNVIEGYEDMTIDLSGLELTFILSDDSTVDWSLDRNDTVNGSSVEWYPATVDDVFGVEISCEDAHLFYPLEVVSSPVKSITYNGSPIKLNENFGGYMLDDYYVYYCDDSVIPDDATVTVEFKDGTTVTGGLNDRLGRGYVEQFDNQEEMPWVVGTNNKYTLKYLGATTYIPVHVSACPFENITLNAAPTRKYYLYDNAFGNVEGDFYALYPEDLTGLSLTATLTNGTTVTLDADDIDMEKRKIGGYSYEMYTLYAQEATTIPFTLNLLGFPVEYEVEVIESPVTAIEILTPPEKVEYEDDFHPFLDGMTVQITLNDNSTESIVLSEQNVTYQLNPFRYCFKIGDFDAFVEYDSDVKSYAVFCAGQNTMCTDLVSVDHVGDIYATTLTPTGEDTELRLEYYDDTEIFLTIESAKTVTLDDGRVEGLAATEQGLVEYYIRPMYVGKQLESLAYCFSKVLDFDRYEIIDSGIVEQFGDLLKEQPMPMEGDGLNLVSIPDEQYVLLSYTAPQDGYYAVYSQGGSIDPRISVYDSQWRVIGNDDDSGEQNHFVFKFTAQKDATYYFVVSNITGRDITFSVGIKESAFAKSVKLKKDGAYPNIIEGTMDSYDLSGLELTFTLNDGSTVDWSIERDELVADSIVQWNPNTVDGVYGMEFTCGEAYFFYPLPTIPNPVKSITYTGSPVQVYENTYGESLDEDVWYYYWEFPEDATVTVLMHDGTTLSGPLTEKLGRSWVDWQDTQEDTPWVLGEDNGIVLKYLGIETMLPVHVLPRPFTDVKVNSAPSRQYYMGDALWGSFRDGEYHLYPADLTGLSFTATLKDGSTVTYDENDIDMDKWTIDGYPFQLDEVVVTEPGKATVILEYKGLAIEYQVDVLASPVEKVEVIKDASHLEYNGSFYPLLDGMQVQVTFTDGSSKTVTLNEQTITYQEGFRYCFKVGELDAFVGYAYDHETEGEYYEIWCIDKVAAYKGFQFDYENQIANVTVVRFNPNVDGTVLRLTYSDGTQKTVTLKNLTSEQYQGNVIGYALTAEGIGFYEIYPDKENGVLVGYDFQFIGYHINIPLEQISRGMLGDLNGDNKIGADDALEVLKMVVGKTSVTEEKQVIADVNTNGQVGADDALEILKKVVGKPSALD